MGIDPAQYDLLGHRYRGLFWSVDNGQLDNLDDASRTALDLYEQNE